MQAAVTLYDDSRRHSGDSALVMAEAWQREGISSGLLTLIIK